jgi:hypothetical protein
MSSVSVKRGDAGIVLGGELTQDGLAASLTNAAEVLFLARARRGGAPAIVGTGAVVDADDGTVQYVLTAEDLANPAGVYFGEWQVTYDDGAVETFPSSGFVELVLYGDLGP